MSFHYPNLYKFSIYIVVVIISSCICLKKGNLRFKRKITVTVLVGILITFAS